MLSARALASLRASGEILWENQQYGAVYAVDSGTLRAQLAERAVILHLGQPDAINAVTTAIPEARWSVISLRCARGVAAARIAARMTGDGPERLAVWDATPPLPHADLTIDTGSVEPDQAAMQIHAQTTDQAQPLVPRG